MPTREEVLRTETFKEDGLDVEHRVFYTITERKELQAQRSIKALSLLVAHLHKRGDINDEELDEFLLLTVR